MGDALHQSLLLRVVQIAHPLAHAAVEDIVGGCEHRAAGAEIAAEEDLPSPALLRLFGGIIVFVFVQENVRIRQPEPVDGLLHVTDHEAVVLFHGQGGEDGILHLVGVLVFIHQNLPEPPALFPRRSGGDDRQCMCLSDEQIQAPVLQIGEIQNPAVLLELAVAHSEGTGQPDQTPHRSGGLGKIGKHRLAGVAEDLQLFGQSVLAGIADRLDPLKKLLIFHIFRLAQHTVADVPPRQHLVPGLRLAKEAQFHQGVAQKLGRLFQGRLLRRLVQALLYGADLHPQVILQLLHQGAAPGGGGRVIDAAGIRHGNTVLQPSLGIQMTPCGVIDLLGDLGNQSVIPSQSLGIHEGLEIGILRPGCVCLIQYLGHGLLPQLAAFVLIAHPEVRRQIKIRRILPQKLGAIGVDGGDLRQVQPLHLPLQMIAAGILRNMLRELGCDLAPQLRRRGLGIGDHQKIVDIGGRRGIHDVLHQPVDQNLGLAGARRCGHQQHTAPVFHSLSLLGRQLLLHSRSSLPIRSQKSEAVMAL